MFTTLWLLGDCKQLLLCVCVCVYSNALHVCIGIYNFIHSNLMCDLLDSFSGQYKFILVRYHSEHISFGSVASDMLFFCPTYPIGMPLSYTTHYMSIIDILYG